MLRRWRFRSRPPLPTPQQVAIFVTSCFGLNSVPLSDFAADGLTCDNAVAYRIE